MATGGLVKQYKMGQIFYSIPYFDQCGCYFVHVDSQKAVFKSCIRTRPSIFLKIAILCQMQAGGQGAFYTFL